MRLAPQAEREPLFVLGCRVDAIDSAEAVRRIVDLASHDGNALVVTLGTEMVVHAQRNARFRDTVNTSALALCDTVGIVLAARLQGGRVAERVAGVDLLDPLCAACAREAIPVYFLGAKGDTARRAADTLRARHPGLCVAGTRDGYFAASEDHAVAAQVRSSGARVLLAGLGSPRQEMWIREHLPQTGCAVGIGVGGSFDVIAGNVVRAPALWRRLNVEWLYRLVQEPHRWRRQLALPHFVWLVLGERARARFIRRLS
ncbi:MAG: WecB/TagA/CpsF family glycosyltransferase [Candidatus Eremiobacteraeota bacterium]|nr:WecB/TagA/CpsF family glycosyltransferase [Candidatus Eremiobacteraeota bacterium]